MKIIGIIAEFNPFHKGHEYLINKAKELSGADAVVVIMSGDFVQRGEPAIWDKFVRAGHALKGGADLVLELPVVYSTGSAFFFAQGAVSLLDRLGVIDELWFGSESADMALFDTVSDVLVNEPEEFSSALKDGLKNGLTFPQARSAALVKIAKYENIYKRNRFNPFTVSSRSNNNTNSRSDVSEDAENEAFIREFLNSPNNILGLEYCIALKKLGSNIVPKTIARLGGGYNDSELYSELSSASAIRQAIHSCHLDRINLKANMKTDIKDVNINEINSTGISLLLNNLPAFYRENAAYSELFARPVFADDFSYILKYKLMCETADSLAQYHDITGDLARRIKQNENKFRSFTQFAMLLKTKNQTYSHICRSLLHIILSIKDEDLRCAADTGYIRVLGMNKKSEELFRKIKEKSAVSLCSKPADLKDCSYSKELFASNLYESVYSIKYGTDFRHEYQRHIIFK